MVITLSADTFSESFSFTVGLTIFGEIKMTFQLNPKQRSLVNLLASIGIQVFNENSKIYSNDRLFYIEINSQDIICKPGKVKSVLNSILNTKTLGLGQSYINGEFNCHGGLEGLFEMLFRLAKTDEVGTLPAVDQIPNSFNLQTKVAMGKIFNFSHILPVAVAKKHYDLPSKLYELMLGNTRKYTCANWSNLEFNAKNANKNLDKAQNQSLAYIIDQLNLKGIDKPVILDCGCGWGAVAKYLLDTLGEGNFTYIGVTIAEEQVKYNQKEFKDIKSVYFYNHSFHNSYGSILSQLSLTQIDGVIFLGSLEHAGPTSTKYILEDIWKILRPSGQIYVQIVGADHKVALLDPYIDRYVFPNTIIMSPGQVGNIIENLRAYRLVRMDNTPQYYYQTLMAWHLNFQQNWENIEPFIAKILHKTEHNSTGEFKRMWEFYLLICAAFYYAESYPQLYRITLKKNLDPKSQRSVFYPVTRRLQKYLNF